MKTSSAIYYIYIYQDVTCDLFFYLSDFDLFVKIKIIIGDMSIGCLLFMLTNNNKATLEVTFEISLRQSVSL